MRISERVDESLIVVGKSWRNFEETVRALVGHLAAAGRLPTELVEATVDGVCRREREASMTMADVGVSIPHLRVPGVQGIVWSLAVATPAVFSVGVGLPISIVALVLSSPSLAGDHLEFLSSLSLLLQSAKCRRELLQAASGKEVLAVIRAFETRGGPLAR